MSTIRERILAGIVTALNVSRPGGVPLVERTRLTEYGEADLPAIVVFPVRDEPKEVGGRRGPVVRSKFTVGIECRAKGTSSVRPDTQADILVAWIVKTLGNLRIADGSGYLNHDIAQGAITFEFDQGDASMCLATVEMVVDYSHLANDAERRN